MLFAANFMRGGGVLTVLLIAWIFLAAMMFRAREALATQPDGPGHGKREWFRWSGFVRQCCPRRGRPSRVEVDILYMFLFWLSVVLFLGIAVPAIYFAWRYRYKPGRVTPHMTHNTLLEIIMERAAADAVRRHLFLGTQRLDEIRGRARRIDGDPGHAPKSGCGSLSIRTGRVRSTIFTCRSNKPVKFVMTSEDVLHDFFVPDMRVKHDIVPGRYTEVWFNPTFDGRASCHLRGILRQGPLRHARRS